MKTVNIAELKNRLSTYIRYVRQGEEVIVRDRTRAVARLVPFEPSDFSQEEQELIAAGIIRPGKRKLDLEAFWKLPMPRVKGNLAVEALLQDREESL